MLQHNYLELYIKPNGINLLSGFFKFCLTYAWDICSKTILASVNFLVHLCFAKAIRNKDRFNFYFLIVHELICSDLQILNIFRFVRRW